MDSSGSQIITFLASVSMLSILVSGIMLISLIQNAFSRDGTLWGLLTMIFPPGTYLFCKKNWDVYGKRFIIMSAFAIVGLLFAVIVRFS